MMTLSQRDHAIEELRAIDRVVNLLARCEREAEITERRSLVAPISTKRVAARERVICQELIARLERRRSQVQL